MSAMEGGLQQCRLFSVPMGGEIDEYENGFKAFASDNKRTRLFQDLNKRADSEDSGSDTDDHDYQAERPLVSDSESGISGSSSEESLQLFDNGLIRIDGEDKLHQIIKQRFISSMGALGIHAQVEAIHRNAFSGITRQAKLQSFLIFSRAMEKKYGGSANTKYAWYGDSKDEINKILSHGFGHCMNGGTYGQGIYLSPDNCPFESAQYSTVDGEGLRHLLLCRVLIGRMELVPPGSKQSHPSSEDYDSGIDNLVSPKKYIIWSTNVNTHILPEFVISFRTPSNQIECQRISVPVKKPTSPWMPFPTLISELSRFLPANAIKQLKKHHRDHKEKKISRSELVQRVRQIAGDKLLTTIIKSYRDEHLKASNELSPNSSSIKRRQWTGGNCACWRND